MPLSRPKYVPNDALQTPYIILNGTYVYLGSSVTIGAGGTISVASQYTDVDGGSFDSLAPLDGGFYNTTVWNNLYDGGTP